MHGRTMMPGSDLAVPGSASAAPRSRLAFDSKVLAIQVAFAAVLAIAIGVQVMKVSWADFASFWAAHHVVAPY